MKSSFFWILIDLIIGFLDLIIKTFDNQTEIWTWLSSPLLIKPFEIPDENINDNHDYFVYKTFDHKSNKPDRGKSQKVFFSLVKTGALHVWNKVMMSSAPTCHNLVAFGRKNLHYLLYTPVSPWFHLFDKFWDHFVQFWHSVHRMSNTNVARIRLVGVLDTLSGFPSHNLKHDESPHWWGKTFHGKHCILRSVNKIVCWFFFRFNTTRVHTGKDTTVWIVVSFPTNFVKSSSYFSITYLSVKILTNCHNLPRNPFQWPICVFRNCIPHRVKVRRDCPHEKTLDFGLSVYSTGHLRFQITHFMSSSMKPRPSKDSSWNRRKTEHYILTHNISNRPQSSLFTKTRTVHVDSLPTSSTVQNIFWHPNQILDEGFLLYEPPIPQWCVWCLL